MKDPYTLEDGTLKNKLGITDYKKLKKAECDIGFIKLMSLDSIDTDCEPTTLIKRIHQHIFGDIFDWAGEYRTVPIYKEEVVIPGISLDYGAPKEIMKSMKTRTSDMYADNWNPNDLDDFAKKMTKHLAKIWRVHPFRDGNTRTTLAFAEIFAKQHGVDFDMGRVLENLLRKKDEETGKIIRYSIRDKFVLAALDEKDYPEPEALQALIRDTISTSVVEKDVES